MPDAEKDPLSLLLRRTARAHLRLKDGDYWPSDVADAQAEAIIAAGYVLPPAGAHNSWACKGGGEWHWHSASLETCPLPPVEGRDS